METTQNYDAIVVGSGQAGTPLSRTLAEAGLKTVLRTSLPVLADRGLAVPPEKPSLPHAELGESSRIGVIHDHAFQSRRSFGCYLRRLEGGAYIQPHGPRLRYHFTTDDSTCSTDQNHRTLP